MQKSFSLQYKNIATYIFCWLMPYNIRQSNVWIYLGQCKNLRGKFINCYLCLQIHSLWS